MTDPKDTPPATPLTTPIGPIGVPQKGQDGPDHDDAKGSHQLGAPSPSGAPNGAVVDTQHPLKP